MPPLTGLESKEERCNYKHRVPTGLRQGRAKRRLVFASQPLQRLARRELNQMSVRIAHHCEVTHDSANVHRRLDENVLLPRHFSNAIDFFARVALKSEMIEAGFYFILHHDQDENRIQAGSCLRSQPNVVTTFRPAIANDRESAKRSVEID